MDSEPIMVWGIVLLGIALVLFMAEVFVPSGGVIGILAACAAIAGIVMLLMFDRIVGIVAAILALISLPFLFGFAIKVFPNTPIGRLISLQDRQERLTDSDGQSAQAGQDELVGAEGKAMTDLRPVGTCRIGDQRRECLATTGVIEAGSQVKVVSVDGMQIKVRRV